jgi:hypothetical protein
VAGLVPATFFLDAVDARQDDTDAIDRDRCAVAILPHERFGGMGEPGEAVRAEKPACPLYRVHEPEDGVEHLGIVGVLLETH